MKHSRLFLTLVILALLAGGYGLGWMGSSVVLAWRGRPAPPSRAAARPVVVTLSPKMKVRLTVPIEWAARVTDGGEGAMCVDLVSVTTPNVLVTHMTLTPGMPGVVVTQAQLDGLLRNEHAEYVKDSLEKVVTPVEMKSKSGIGAYSVLSIESGRMGGAARGPLYSKTVDGWFVTGGVAVKFVMFGGADPKVIQFIEEGVAVETAK